MDPRLEKLIQAFETRGWILVGSVDISSDWWFQDIIRLDSTWRPAGTAIYLTLLTDPQITDRKEVWRVGFSSVIPKTRDFTYIDGINLKDIKKQDLLLLVEEVNARVLNHGVS